MKTKANRKVLITTPNGNELHCKTIKQYKDTKSGVLCVDIELPKNAKIDFCGVATIPESCLENGFFRGLGLKKYKVVYE